MRRILKTGLLVGLAMNVLGWIGNQLILGREWKAALAGSSFGANRHRTVWNELGSLAPDFIYGIALVWLCWIVSRVYSAARGPIYVATFVLWAVAIATPLLGTANSSFMPWRVTIMTVLLALVIMIPVSELVRWRLAAHLDD